MTNVLQTFLNSLTTQFFKEGILITDQMIDQQQPFKGDI